MTLTHACSSTNSVFIIGEKLIDPYGLPDFLNVQSYLQFERSQMPELLEDIRLAVRSDISNMHDRAPAHFSWQVRQYLGATYHNRWSGHVALVEWPYCSPTLTLLIIICRGTRRMIIIFISLYRRSVQRNSYAWRCLPLTESFPPQTSLSLHCWKRVSFRTLPMSVTVICTTTTWFVS